VLSKFKLWVFNRVLKGLLKKNETISRPEINPAKRVILLYNCTDNGDRKEILSYVKALKKEGKSVDLVGFFDQKEKPETIDIPHPFFTRKETNWYAKTKDEFLNEWKSNSYDILFNLDLSGSKPLILFTAAMNVPFKVGFSGDYPQLYHLIIETEATAILPNALQDLRKTLNVLSVS
jgi:hypothetical protein